MVLCIYLIDLSTSEQFFFQLEKLHALGLKPLLLIAYLPKRLPGTSKTKVMMPVYAHLNTSAKTCLENVDTIYKLTVEGEIAFI